ncbi:MAG: ATP-binding protein [Nanoarchaeota archaeon]|nr:ATP-binding protein [Nanoarchaeota archaeon]
MAWLPPSIDPALFLDVMSFRRLAYFLGTPGGELLKRAAEMVFYLLIVWMILAEYRQRKRRDYKYLAAGFFALFARNAIMSLILFSGVFGTVPFTRFSLAFLFLDQALESLALLAIVGAFLFPVFRKCAQRFQGLVMLWSVGVGMAHLAVYTLVKQSLCSQPLGEALVDAIQISVLLLPFFVIRKASYQRPRFARSVLVAFAVYIVWPLTNVISYLLIGYVDPRVRVIEHPLPFISMFLLLRAVYLDMVDKAGLYSKLRQSEATIQHEKKLNQLKDNFISIVSHELRTPLTSIKLYLALLRQGKFGKILPKQESAMKTVYDESTRLSDLITDLLTLKKMESGKLELEKVRFSLPEIIDDLYIHIAREKGMSVEAKLAPCAVLGDRNRLKQVFINLMNNAIKFSEKGGTITLSCGNKGNQCFFAVSDTGSGIPKEELPKIFDKFYQVEDALTRKNQGIGLGLSIVKQIVELHGGTVDVKSEVGKGSTFTVWIPKN